MKLLLSHVEEKRANLKSAYDVDSCVASLPAPPPPPCFAGWSPSPAIAGADEERCAAPSSPSFDRADAAHGFRRPKHSGKMSN
jgi:hypothetical protein